MKRHLGNDYFDKSNLNYKDCIDCGKCIRCCPIIAKDNRSPKQFLERLINPSGEEFDDASACLKCGYCHSVCPKSIHIGELLYELKKVNVKFSKDKKYRQKYRIIVSHQKNSFRKLFINVKSSNKVFFPGCSLSASNPNLVKELSKRLKNQGIDLFSGCCASPSYISGDCNLFKKNRGIIESKIVENNIDEIIVACSNCYVALQGIEGVKVRSIYNLLLDEDIIDYKKANLDQLKEYIVHDPCPTRLEDEIHSSVRELLSRADIKYVEFKNNKKNTSCCGDGSMVSVLNTDISTSQLEKRVCEAEGKNIISYCQSCVNNFRSQNNKSMHILEILMDTHANYLKENTSVHRWFNRYTISKYVDKL